MISIVYVSDAVSGFTDEALSELLDVSRRNNGERDLTGVLLYKDGQFMQALEGAEDAVAERLAVITADPRHSNVRTLLTEQVDERRFPDWSMGFRTTDELRKLPGYNDFFDRSRDAVALVESGSRARQLLEWFRLRSV